MWKANWMRWGVCRAQSRILVRTQGEWFGGGECRAWGWSVRKDSGIEHTGACGHGFGVALVRLSPRFVVFRARVPIMQLCCQACPVLVAGEVILFSRCEWNAQVGWRSTDEGFGPCQPDLPRSPQPPPLIRGLLSQMQFLQLIKIEAFGNFLF
jgi:hypothetical protein